VEAADRGTAAGSAGTLWAVEDLPRAAAPVDRDGTWERTLTRARVYDDSGRSSGSSVWAPASCVFISTPLEYATGGSAGGIAIPVQDGEALGRSRGGLTTKVHLAVDGRGRPLSVLPTGGQAGVNPQLFALLDAIRVHEAARAGHGRSRTADRRQGRRARPDPPGVAAS
jgi:hypothetical protein